VNVPVGATGGVVALTVTALPECAWTAVAQASWITDLAPAAGQGSGQVEFRVVANSGSSARQADILLNDVRVALTQAGRAAVPAPEPPPGTDPQPSPSPTPAPQPSPSPPPACAIALAPASFSVAAGGAAGLEIAVTAPSGCDWTAASSGTWLTITSGHAGTGAGAVIFSVAANSGAARVGAVTIGGQSVTVSQASGCVFTVAPTRFDVSADPASGLTVQVTTGAGCTWSAVSHDAWINVTSGASGSGSGTVVFDVSGNLLGNTRTGSLTVAGTPVTVRQDRWRLLP
jgi:hypothetical protein